MINEFRAVVSILVFYPNFLRIGKLSTLRHNYAEKDSLPWLVAGGVYLNGFIAISVQGEGRICQLCVRIFLLELFGAATIECLHN